MSSSSVAKLWTPEMTAALVPYAERAWYQAQKYKHSRLFEVFGGKRGESHKNLAEHTARIHNLLCWRMFWSGVSDFISYRPFAMTPQHVIDSGPAYAAAYQKGIHEIRAIITRIAQETSHDSH